MRLSVINFLLKIFLQNVPTPDFRNTFPSKILVQSTLDILDSTWSSQLRKIDLEVNDNIQTVWKNFIEKSTHKAPWKEFLWISLNISGFKAQKFVVFQNLIHSALISLKNSISSSTNFPGSRKSQKSTEKLPFNVIYEN